MPAIRPPAPLAALQARVDQVAQELFADPGWTGPVPGVRVDSRVAGANRALGGVHHGIGLIRVSPEVAAEPEDCLRGTLAHEAGHIALGHQRAAHLGWALSIGIALWALAIVCRVIGVQCSTIQPTRLLFGLPVALALIALRLIVIPSRRSELATDRWSATLIGTDAVLRTLQHLDAHCSRLSRLTASLGMDTHPSPRRRVHRLRDDHMTY